MAQRRPAAYGLSLHVAPTRQRTRVAMTGLDAQRFRFVAESAVGDGARQVEGTEHYVSTSRRR